MSVKIRLTRMGKKKQPSYRVVVMDSRKPRDGEYLEQIGRYDPRQDPSIVEIDNDRALDWLQKGAQPTERARKLLEISGAWMRFRVSKGDIYTVGETEAPSAEEAPAEEAVSEPAEPEHEPEVHVVGDPIPEDEPEQGTSSEDSASAPGGVASSDAPEAEGDDTVDATDAEASSE
jgi:small subunit ribosomal protein S16